MSVPKLSLEEPHRKSMMIGLASVKRNQGRIKRKKQKKFLKHNFNLCSDVSKAGKSFIYYSILKI